MSAALSLTSRSVAGGLIEVSNVFSADCPHSSPTVRLGMMLWPGASASSVERLKLEVTLSIVPLQCHSKPIHRLMKLAERAKRRSDGSLCGVARSCRRTRGKDNLILSSRTRDQA